MSRFQYIPDPKLEGFGYFVWGYVGEEDRIYPIILTEDHSSDTSARFPIVISKFTNYNICKYWKRTGFYSKLY